MNVFLHFFSYSCKVYTNAIAYQAALPSSVCPSVDDEAQDHEVLSPPPPTADGSLPGRKTMNTRIPLLPPRSPSDASSSTQHSPTPNFFTSLSGGMGLPTSTAVGVATATAGAGGGVSGGGGLPPYVGHVGGGAGSVGVGGLGGEIGSTPNSPRVGRFPELLRQVGLQVIVMRGAH